MISRSRRAAAILTSLVTGLLAAVAVPDATQAAPDTPLTAADKNLLTAVRLAGLWERPAGDMAVRKGGTDRVRQVGAEIAKQHAQLDRLVVDAANKLSYRLPTEPNADQQTWLAEMAEAKAGRDFDQVFVDRLRAAHGKVFPIIGEVRAGTRNDIVRKLAADANGLVLNHLTLLESTGLVRYSDLPQSDAAQAGVQPDRGWLGNAIATGKAGSENVPAALMWLVLLVALAAGGLATIKMFRRT